MESPEKRQKITNNVSVPSIVQPILNKKYLQDEFLSKLHTAFTGEQDFDEDDCIVKTKPFAACVLSDLMNEDFLQGLKKELDQETWFLKRNDLYEFYQSEDLKLATKPHLKALRELLYGPEFKKMMHGITGLEFSDKVDLSASRYPPKGYLACHDDDIADSEEQGRRIAFIIYLVDKDWNDEDGGRLDLFDRDEDDLPKKVVTKLTPGYNKFAFFETAPTSYHQVSEVTGKRDRLSITGWYHGPYSGKHTVIEKRPFHLEPISVDIDEKIVDEAIFDGTYWKESSQDAIGDVLIEKSMVELRQVLSKDLYGECFNLVQDLKGDVVGPANQRRYTRFFIQPNPTGNPLEKLTSQFISGSGLKLIQALTNLEFTNCTLEWRRFDLQDYTLLHDNDETQQSGVDVVLFFANGEWLDCGGGHVYVNGSNHVTTLQPVENSMSIVFREDETMRFVKMVNHAAPGPRYELCLSYRE